MHTSLRIGWRGAVLVGWAALCAVWVSAGAERSLAAEPPNFSNAVLEAYMKARHSDQADRFGDSVALDGNTLVVGAPNEASCTNGVNGDQTNNGCP